MLSTILILILFVAAGVIWVKAIKSAIEEFRSPCCKKPMKQTYNYLHRKLVYRCTHCNKDIL